MPPTRDEFERRLAEALKTEFPFVMGLGITADDEAWAKSAAAIASKMGVYFGDSEIDGRMYLGLEG